MFCFHSACAILDAQKGGLILMHAVQKLMVQM